MNWNKKFKSKEAMEHEVHTHQTMYLRICITMVKTIIDTEHIAVQAISDDDYAHLEEIENAERGYIRTFIQYRDLLEPEYLALIPQKYQTLIERLDYCLN